VWKGSAKLRAKNDSQSYIFGSTFLKGGKGGKGGFIEK
jgi:hypothetical protein